jgi:hypothetical protein
MIRNRPKLWPATCRAHAAKLIATLSSEPLLRFDIVFVAYGGATEPNVTQKLTEEFS